MRATFEQIENQKGFIHPLLIQKSFFLNKQAFEHSSLLFTKIN